MKTYQLKQNLKQVYQNYTSEDKAVWKLLFERQVELLSNLAAPEYLEALSKIGFTANKIPNFNETNAILNNNTGWQLEVVEGIINESDFFELLSKKQFPATTWLRKLNELDYLPEPDMFHDVFGHVPLLIEPKFSNFFEEFGKLGVKHKDEPQIVQMLGRIYWFTIEFGLIKSKGQLKIYGAGILSSHGESRYSVSEEPAHLQFDAKTIMNTSFDNDKIQDKYFVIDSFDQLYKSMSLIQQVLSDKLKLLV
jgi:phenylalanine-4-hydroxylase